MYSKVKSINKRHNIFLRETFSRENSNMNSSFNIQMSFIRIDTIVLYGTITYQERCSRELLNPSLARSYIPLHKPPRDNELLSSTKSKPPSKIIHQPRAKYQAISLLLQGALKH